jgi:competence protein ComEA
MTDGEDVRTRVEDALRRAASTAYEAAHGALEGSGAFEGRGAFDDRNGNDAAPRWRFRVSPRVAVTVTIVVAILGGMIVFLPPRASSVAPDVAAASAASSQAGTSPTTPPGTSPGTSPTTPPGTSQTVAVGFPAGHVVVHVAGAVSAPGLYTLDGGARVADAVAAAGGAAAGADLDALNLARVVVDGEQVRVPLLGEPAVGLGSVGGAASTDGKVNINIADVAELDRLPGVGPVLAARIAEYRAAHGPFVSVDALDDVSGVGPALLEKVRAAATV